MSIGPILPGRIPGSLIANRLKENLNRATTLLAQLQEQVATGQRFFTPGEAPADAIRSIVLQKSIERKTQMQANVDVDRSFLVASESALTTVSDALNQAKTFVLAGSGDSASNAEREALAVQVAGMVRGVVNAGNTKFRGRYLFAGSHSQTVPFEIVGGGMVKYHGDQGEINSYIDLSLLQANNVDGATAFGAVTEPVGKNVNPALTLQTKLSDLLSGRGVQLGTLVVTVDDTVNPPQTAQVDLSGAETIGDVETLLEAAFAGGPPTLDVDIDPATNSGLRLRPAGGVGTVTVTNITGSTTGNDLGIAGGPAATITGSDLDPRLTLLTPLSALNGGTGIGTTAGNGLVITSGTTTKTVDISTATTVEDLFNLLESENLSLSLGINAAGNGLAISSRLSGAPFSVGENNGTNAVGLGIRTFDTATLLGDLNFGHGVPVTATDSDGALLPAVIEIERRDGTTVSSIDLKGLQTVQQVIDAITAVDANLTASLNTVGNGISIVDSSGTNPLVVRAGAVADALGISGSETGTNNAIPVAGRDVNQRRAHGVLSLLVQLENALSTNDLRALERLDPLFDAEIERFSAVRGELGGRMQVLDQIENRLLDDDVNLQEALSVEFDTDLTDAITRIANIQSTMQATLSIAASSLQLSLVNFL